MHGCRNTRDKVVIGGEIELHSMIGGEVSIDSLIDGQAQPVWVSTSKDHAQLINRDLPDQHPISAITGLQDALDSKIDISDISIINCGTSTEVI